MLLLTFHTFTAITDGLPSRALNHRAEVPSCSHLPQLGWL